MITPAACPLCGGGLAPFVARPRSSYAEHGRYRIDRCTSCGAGTTVPRPTDLELAACYDDDYDYGAHALIEPEKRWRARQLVRWAGVTGGRVLDLGCMFGYLLDEARRAGAQTWGVEPAEAPRAAAAARGHDVAHPTLEALAAAAPAQRFDAIFVQHVLEHVPDPIAFVGTAATLLAPGGQLVITVPNLGARLRRLASEAWGWYQVPVHLHHLDDGSLRHLLARAGLRTARTTTRGGDSLFAAITALRVVGIEPARGGAPGRLARAGLRVAGAALRGYYRAGDDELSAIALRA